jgi:molybdenum cofactor synthesis domain-containing protein
MEPIRIISVNISEKKGTIKIPVDEIILNDRGIMGDAHAGSWHRQVSLLGVESFEKMTAAAGRTLQPGEFAENITTQGFPLYHMHPLDQLAGKEVLLEVTQIGKKCHGERCTIFRQTGDCVMPREGIFCRVIRGGALQSGDALEFRPRILKAAVITLSDRASRGEYKDKSGPLLKQLLEEFFTSSGHQTQVELQIIPDDPQQVRTVIRQSLTAKMDFIFTTGGTGIGPRDIAPDVIRPMLDKEIPGIMEMIRVKYGMQFPNALISRSIAGLIGNTLVYILPGSPKAVSEYMGEILKTLEHSLLMLYGIDKHG